MADPPEVQSPPADEYIRFLNTDGLVAAYDRGLLALEASPSRAPSAPLAAPPPGPFSLPLRSSEHPSLSGGLQHVTTSLASPPPQNIIHRPDPIADFEAVSRLSSASLITSNHSTHTPRSSRVAHHRDPSFRGPGGHFRTSLQHESSPSIIKHQSSSSTSFPPRGDRRISMHPFYLPIRLRQGTRLLFLPPPPRFFPLGTSCPCKKRSPPCPSRRVTRIAPIWAFRPSRTIFIKSPQRVTTMPYVSFPMASPSPTASFNQPKPSRPCPEFRLPPSSARIKPILHFCPPRETFGTNMTSLTPPSSAMAPHYQSLSRPPLASSTSSIHGVGGSGDLRTNPITRLTKPHTSSLFSPILTSWASDAAASASSAWFKISPPRGLYRQGSRKPTEFIRFGRVGCVSFPTPSSLASGEGRPISFRIGSNTKAIFSIISLVFSTSRM